MFGTSSRIVYYNGTEYLANNTTIIAVQGINKTIDSSKTPMKVLYSNCEVWV